MCLGIRDLQAIVRSFVGPGDRRKWTHSDRPRDWQKILAFAVLPETALYFRILPVSSASRSVFSWMQQIMNDGRSREGEAERM